MACQSVTRKLRNTDREIAIREVSRGQELMSRLQSRLRLTAHNYSTGDLNQLESANDLSNGILRALTVSLSILKSTETLAEGGSHRSNGKVMKRAASGDRHENEKVVHKRRRNSTSWTKMTPAPHFDGHQWRKYGQKMIHKSKYPRDYYRCTHRNDQGCLATKQVQQEGSEKDLPMFSVTYNNQHTCRTTTQIPAAQFILSSLPNYDQNFLVFDPTESNPQAFSGAINEEQYYPQSSSSTPGEKEESDGKISSPQSDEDSSMLVNDIAVSDECLMEMMDHVLSVTSFDIEDFLQTSGQVAKPSWIET